MCYTIKTISKVKSGELTLCKDCNIYHLTFNNIYIEFDKKQLLQFKKRIVNINPDHWENLCINKKRKILVQTSHQNLFLVFNRQELIELKVLLSQKTTPINILNVDDIDYTLILN